MMPQIVSDKAIIREMDANELEQEWEETSRAHKQHITSRSYQIGDITRYAERFTLIAKQYHQLTGKVLE